MAPEDSWIPKDQTGNPWHLNLQNKKNSCEMGYYTVYLAVISPCFSSQGKFCQEGHLLLSERKSTLMAQNLVRSSDWSICSYS